MTKTKVKSTIVTSLVLAIMACTSTVPPNNQKVTEKGNFQDLDKEFGFSTEALIRPYLTRKLETFLTPPIRGTSLLRDLLYGMYKHPQLLCTIISKTPGMKDAINNVPEVQERKKIDIQFQEFIDGIVLNSEFQVNTTNTNFQEISSVAMDSAGDFVVTWANFTYESYSRYEIFAQRYNSSGQAQGPEFQVSTALTSGTGGSAVSSVAMDSTGDFVIVWDSKYRDENNNSYHVSVHGKRYNSIGEQQDDEFIIGNNSETTDSQGFPSIAMDGSGDFVVTWMDYHSGFESNPNLGVFAQRYNSLAVPQGSDFMVNDPISTSSASIIPSIAMDSAGDFVITWSGKYQDEGNTVFGRVYGKRYNSFGDVQNSQFIVHSFDPTSYFENSSVAMDSAGDFVVSRNSIFIGSNGASINSLSASNKNESFHNFVNHINNLAGINGKINNAEVNTNNLTGGLYGKLYDHSGTPGTEFLVKTFTNADNEANIFRSVAMDSTGDFVFTWSDYIDDNNRFDTFARRYDSSGHPKEASFQVNSFTTSNQYFSSAAMDSAGDFVITWTGGGNQDGDSYGIFAERYDNSGGVNNCSIN